MAKKKYRKKRKIGSYAMGSGNTGVIKNYMADPSEVFRQNEIDINRAQYEGSSNPFVIGLKALGGLTTQVGMSMMGNEEVKVDTDLIDSDLATPSKLGEFIGASTNGDGMYAAKGTSSAGTGTKVNAEAGEIVETPDGGMAELGGKKHTDGGENLEVPEGTLIFSDQLKVGGKTMAERKKAREASLSKMKKNLAKDPSDAINKETFRKSKAKYDYEEKNDLMIQGIAGEMDKMMSFAFGTSSKGVQYANGTGWQGVKEGAKDFLGGFTPGDYLGMAGTMYSTLAPLMDAKKNAAEDTPNKNFYKDYGQKGLATLDEADDALSGIKAQAERKLETGRNTAMKGIRNRSRGINSINAQSLGVDANYNSAMTDLYTNFSKTMMENIYKKVGAQNQIDQIVMGGAKEADIANRMDKDNSDTQIGAMKGNFGEGLQQIGKDLNINKRSRVLDNLAAQLSKYGLFADEDGIISKKN